MPQERVKRNIQRNIGIASGIFAAIILLSNLYVGFFELEYSFLEMLPSVQIAGMFMVTIFCLIAGLWHNIIPRIILVSVFVGMGLWVSYSEPTGNLTGVFIYVVGIIIAMRFDLLRKFFWLKIVTLLSLEIIAKLLGAAIHSEIGIIHGISDAVTPILFGYILWTAFAEEIRIYADENRELKETMDRNRVFVEFGKRTAGVVHNMKSRITAISGAAHVAQTHVPEEHRAAFALHNEAVEDLQQSVDSLMTTVRSFQQVTLQPLRINEIIKGVMVFTEADIDAGKRVQIITDLTNAPDIIYARPTEVAQVIDNVIKNAQESMERTSGFKVHVTTKNLGQSVEVAIQDEGEGIEFIPQNREIDVTEQDIFSVGRTTKIDGTGLGMDYVITTMRRMEGRVLITTNEDGTRVKLIFPLGIEL
ncbi:MAG: sensor histidine kinase [Spirochaetia bacterium]